MYNIKYPFFIFLFFVLSCCNDAKVADAIENKTDTAIINTNPLPLLNITEPKDSLEPALVQAHELPANVSFKGNEFHSAYKWYDKSGHNLLMFSVSSANITDKEFGETEHSGELFVQLFNLKDPKKPNVVWDLYDSEKKCIFDITCAFITVDITDLDKDSIKEVSVLYKLACRSDVSPAYMKLIMHEGKKKYALRGNMIFFIRDIPDSLFPETREIDLSKVSEDELKNIIYRGWGCFENTNDFNNAPPVFLEHARELWKQNSVE